MKPGPGLRVFGLGLRPSEDVTLEALQALEACAAVYHDLEDPAQRAWLERALPGAKPAPAAAALAREAKTRAVGLAVWGHPQHASETARLALAAARAAKVPAASWCANSPAARAIAKSATFIGRDEGYGGAVSVPAAALGREGRAARRELPLIVYDQRGAAATWEAAARALAPLYPEGHEARVFPCEGEERRVKVRELGALRGGAAVMILPLKELMR